jgi:hypothetical protein
VPASGVVEHRRKGLVRLSPGEQFWIRRNSADAATMNRSEPATGGVLAATGLAANANVAASGSILLTAPSGVRRVKVTFTATNACGAVTASAEGVAIAPPYQPPVLSVVAPFPADIDVVMGVGGGEKLQPEDVPSG